MPAITTQNQTSAASAGIRYRTRLGNLNGAPAVFVNGKPIFLGAPYLFKAPYEHFTGVGTGVYMVYDQPFGVGPDGSIETATVEKPILELLEREPEALVMVRTYPPVPKWWKEKYPDEMLRFDSRTYEGDSNQGDSVEFERMSDASWGSDVWLNDVCSWYRAWSGALHRRFSGQVIGHEFGMGICGENGVAGAPCFDGRWFCGDFSPAMTSYFRSYLAAKYGNDSALRKAWGDPNVTLETAQVPDRIERQRTEWFTFRSPLRAQASDYHLAYAQRVQQIVISICQAIKDGAQGECLAGSHLGHILDNGFHGMLALQTGTSRIREALDHPAVDFFTGPASYDFRVPGGDANSMIPHGSIALHGKMIYQDQDTRTSVLPHPDYREAYIMGEIAADLDESEHVLKRDFAHALIRGYGLWWHAMSPGMFDHPHISECLRRLTAIGRASLQLPRGIAEGGAAMIIDEESSAWQQTCNRLIYPMLYFQRQQCWGRSGLAWNAHIHNDLDHPAMPRHKLYYFLNTFFLTDTEMESIQKRLRGSGATVIWTYAPGIQSPAGLDLERASRLTGFKLKSVDIEALPMVTITNARHPYVAGAPITAPDPYNAGDQVPITFGTGKLGGDDHDRGIGPIIYVDDPGAMVLGVVSAILEPGFCVKEMDGWTSVYSSAPMLNQHLLRNIGRAAGLHIWSEGDDVVLPGRGFVMIHTKKAGGKAIRLPFATDVYECYDGRLVGNNITEIRESMPKHATALYFLGGKDEFEAALDPAG